MYKYLRNRVMSKIVKLVLFINMYGILREKYEKNCKYYLNY